MKLRDSGMPDERYWETLFDVPLILGALGIDADISDVVELGCGYGTFSVPVAQAISGQLHTFDIDPQMVARTKERATSTSIDNISCKQRDVIAQGFGVANDSVDAVLLFNVLHCEQPQALLLRAAQMLRVEGAVLVIHWRFDPNTPRGPSLDIRPKPEQIVVWAEQTGQLRSIGSTIDLPPWHYGLRFERF